MIDLNVQHVECVVKVGDTMEDIREGLNAKVWTVGVVIGSSELGLSETEVKNIAETELKEKTDLVRTKMTEAGAHFVIDSITELPDIIERINSLFSTT
jgi:phosphonoacetaldehyde hydrolase